MSAQNISYKQSYNIPKPLLVINTNHVNQAHHSALSRRWAKYVTDLDETESPTLTLADPWKVAIVLEELGLPYETKFEDMSKLKEEVSTPNSTHMYREALRYKTTASLRLQTSLGWPPRSSLSEGNLLVSASKR
jgi:hypothetical protein